MFRGKSEARNPKSETNSKSEIKRKTKEWIKPEKKKKFEINPRSSNAQVGRF
jgi:hypothetical protein